MEIKVNNINLYYEEYGSGQPIILLHGNQETHEIFDKLINKLKDNYKVYAIDSRCHGKSENPKELSYNLMFTIPVHVLAGEKDVIKLEHTKLIADNIENSTMEIIPKEKHGSYIIHSEKIYEIIKKYI